MYGKININISNEKVRYFLIFVSILAIFILGRVAYDNTSAFDIGKEKITVFKNPDFIPVKEFLLSKINSPFLHLNYEIKKGDTIQNILQKNKIKNLLMFSLKCVRQIILVT